MTLTTDDIRADLMLTDDELAAIAIDRDTYWPADLPTVDTDDPADLLSAMIRGRRSLLVRGLIDDEGTADGSVEMLGDHLAGATHTITVYLGGPDLLRVSPVLASVHYPMAGYWVAETITPGGVHAFTNNPRDIHIAYLQRIMQEAVSTGLPPEGVTGDEPWFVCVAVSDGQQTTIHAARKGEYQTAATASDGTVSSRITRLFDVDTFARSLPD